MFKNKLFTFLFSLTFSFVLFIPTVVSLVSTNNEDIVSIIDFSSEEEEQKSEIENLEFKITFENDSNLFHHSGLTLKSPIFYSENYASIDRELHLPPPEYL
jgi:hypothetical protein